ncbi:glycosyltransferase family 9 protein [Denitrobaculum tricleocarpae]|uniref:Glycosyltransferase family 9 protein n=1 Tax=Denitrobaculum tricleocarpae TaxID=2591009 RepID=A0A545TQT6_9PROT|nr:glycosyltransferase family 9 protein [Denitrobaculum tricleocarpae]TQV79580.1 glycosyltransferase family 9 protein [Denitrobaculum tricleocarpae]
MRILFITSNRIGDAVQSTGILSALIERHPGAEITVAAGAVCAPLFEAVPGLQRLLPMKKRKHAGHWRDLWWQCVGTRWDLVVDLRASKFSWTVRCRRSLTVTSKLDDEPRVLELARLIGEEANPPAPKIWLAVEHERAALEAIPDGDPVLAVGPTANWIGKTWMLERFVDLARRLTGPAGPLQGARLAVLGAPGEEAQAAALMHALPANRTIDLVGKAGLLTTAACLKRCVFFVGNDSGLMHMSAAVGVPTLGLFGPSSERRYGPWGAHCGFVRTPESLDEIINQPGYHHTLPKSWMTSLQTDSVEEAALALMQRLNVGSAAQG